LLRRSTGPALDRNSETRGNLDRTLNPVKKDHEMTLSEKIETIVLCYLQSGTKSGTCGSLVARDGRYLVRPEGSTSVYGVRTTPIGYWEVRHGTTVGCDRSLIDAAHLVTNQ
jgi:hypothetical protein